MKYAGFTLGALAVCALLAVLISPFASSSPDGLERVAEDHGFVDQAAESPAWQHSPAPDYSLPPIRREGLSTAAAGLAGTLITFVVAWLLAARVARRRKPAPRPEGPA